MCCVYDIVLWVGGDEFIVVIIELSIEYNVEIFKV